MKAYYTKKGKFEDGRNKICIEYLNNGKIVTKFLPKPEKMLKYLALLNYGRKKHDFTKE